MPNQNKIIWIEILRRRSTLLFSYFARKGESTWANMKKALGIDFAIPNAKEVDTRIIIDAKSADRFRSLISNRVKKEPWYFNEYARRCLIYCERLLSLAQKISETKVNKLDDKDLGLLYQKYVNRTLELIPFLNPFVLLNDILTEMIKARVEKEGLGEISLEEIVAPTEINFVVQEIEDMLKIASKVSKKPELERAIIKGNQKQIREILNKEKEIKLLIGDHIRKFGWMTTQAYVGNFMESEDIIGRLQNLLLENPQKKLTDAKQRRQRAKRKFNNLFKSPKLSEETKKLLKIASQYLYLRFYRIDVLWIAHYHVANLYQEMAKRLGITYDEILYLTHEEILRSLKEGSVMTGEEIRKRQTKFALLILGGKARIYAGDEVDELLQKEEVKEEATAEKEIKGTVACQGRAEGRVKIVMDPKIMRKVKRGDVLVTNMTTPDLMPAIEKVAAIVTDEGGMLCHAAIVSRELGIPCVIGTKIATRVLKDEDLVEVNAEEGVVKILEKSK